MRPAARLGDMLVCYLGCTPGPIGITYNWNTFINMRPAACLGDKTFNCIVGVGCWAPSVSPLITGSWNTFINGRPACRLFDLDLGGVIVTGSLDTFIG